MGSRPGGRPAGWPVGGLLLALALGGCAAFVCQPLTVVVAKKDERRRVDVVPGGIRTTESGRVEEVETFRVLTEYWVQSQDGARHRVSADQFKTAEVGRPLEICR